jgi:hypothetical protein
MSVVSVLIPESSIDITSVVPFDNILLTLFVSTPKYYTNAVVNVLSFSVILSTLSHIISPDHKPI